VKRSARPTGQRASRSIQQSLLVPRNNAARAALPPFPAAASSAASMVLPVSRLIDSGFPLPSKALTI